MLEQLKNNGTSVPLGFRSEKFRRLALSFKEMDHNSAYTLSQKKTLFITEEDFPPRIKMSDIGCDVNSYNIVDASLLMFEIDMFNCNIFIDRFNDGLSGQ